MLTSVIALLVSCNWRVCVGKFTMQLQSGQGTLLNGFCKRLSAVALQYYLRMMHGGSICKLMLSNGGQIRAFQYWEI